MLVSPRPGVNRENLLNDLRRVHTDVFNLRGGGGRARNAYERLLEYLNWASDAMSLLGNQISGADLERLVLTRRYEQLLAGVGTLGGSDAEKVVNLLVSLELRERVDAFDAAIKALDALIKRWSGPGDFFVPDSSFYIEHEQKLEDAGFHAYIATWPDHPVHLLVPIVVVDELDGLKRSKDKHVRWRAGYTLAVFDRLFARMTERALLKQPEVSPENRSVVVHGAVTLELVFDPQGHVRLPINDDEIVDRAAAIQALVGRDVTMLTYDTSQAMRGRRAGLKVEKLSKPIGEEPTQGTATGR